MILCYNLDELLKVSIFLLPSVKRDKLSLVITTYPRSTFLTDSDIVGFINVLVSYNSEIVQNVSVKHMSR